MGKLYFNVTEVKPLLEHSSAAPSQRASFAHMFDKRFWKDGAQPSNGYVRAEDVDTSKIEPSVILVKDDGAYLMSNGSPGLLAEAQSGRHQVTYAKHCNPKTDPDCWETARRLVGGDDFAEPLPIRMFQEMLNAKPSAETIVVNVLKTKITVEAK